MTEFASPAVISSLHNCDSFDCGSVQLNDFLKLHALDKQNAKLSRTYAVERTQQIVAYYTLAFISVSQQTAPKKFGRGVPSEIPAILMARLAVDLSVQAIGLGKSILVDALTRTWSVMQVGAAPVRLFVVDAKDENAKAFYERFDMISPPGDQMRLFLSYKTLAMILAPGLPE